MGASRWAGLLGCAVILVLPAAGAQAATPRIVYQAIAADGDDNELFTVRPDGSKRRRLTHGELHDTDPSWSPNHRWIVFRRYPTCTATPCDETEPRLYKIRADGERFREIPNTVGAGAPSWSPGGARIAFVDLHRTGHGIFTIRPDGTGRRLVAYFEHDAPSVPDWSPDGRRLVYGTSPNGIAIVNVRTGRTRVVARFGMDPSWSPGGKRIAWEGHRRSRVGTVGEVYTARPDGSRRRRVTSRRRLLLCPDDFHCQRYSQDPAWSPTGRRIAFSEDTSRGEPVLYTVRPNGRGVRRIARGGRNPDW